MAVYFFDSSALVKRYAQETGSAWVEILTDPQAGPCHQTEASFYQALDVARHQAAKMWELRATVSLSRL